MLLPVDMDGHTLEGGWTVTIELTADQIEQLIRSMEWATMMDSHEDTPDHPQRMDYLAHREFLKEIIVKLRAALESQAP